MSQHLLMANGPQGAIDAVNHMVWWLQLLVSLGLAVLAVALDKLDAKFDIGLFGMLAWPVGIASFILGLNAVFGGS